jgi:NADPH-dependent glutamate synthase beta subunit-like oxidoreductase/Pyruvate/2-oxoacid:ferredoxin oxidoreductase delta subunit
MTIERIDQELCNGCGICVDSCSVDVLRLDTLAAERRESPPCSLACPAGVDMRRYIHLLREGMIEEALEVLRDSLPLPAVTGRICPHPCELDCARKDIDEAVNINALERYVGDFSLQQKARPARRLYSARVAIAGSGPAGLAAACDLVKIGYPVTVFEALPVTGGMLRMGIPEYRLPKNVLDAQIEYIRDLGVEFRTGISIGKDVDFARLKEQGYQALFLATGSQQSKKLEMPGIDLEGVVWGLDFLKSVNLKLKPEVKEKVLLIGGGNVAMDAALTALRLGARKVELACLESQEEMPAYREEIRQAQEEGISLNPGWGPGRILSNGQKVAGVTLIKCTAVYDRQGRFKPVYDENTTKTIEADMLVFAIGQTSDLSLIPAGVTTTPEGTIQVDPATLATSLPGVFAGGDITSGQGSAVQAIGAGKKVAVSIDRYLKGDCFPAGQAARRRIVSKPPREKIEVLDRQTTPLLPSAKRALTFKEIKTGMNEDAVLLETRRCATCGSRAVIRYPEQCMACDSCEINCPQNAIYVSPERHAELMVGWR